MFLAPPDLIKRPPHIGVAVYTVRKLLCGQHLERGVVDRVRAVPCPHDHSPLPGWPAVGAEQVRHQLDGRPNPLLHNVVGDVAVDQQVLTGRDRAVHERRFVRRTPEQSRRIPLHAGELQRTVGGPPA